MKQVVTLICMLALVCLVGCSGEKKEEAARLEQELLGGATPTETTVTDTVQHMVDEAVPEEVEHMGDAGAIPDEEPPAMPEQPVGSGYTVQVASCESSAFASHLVSLYTERGYEPFVTEATVGGQLFYRVRIGVFAGRSEAAGLQKELQDRFSLKTWIDVVE